jgi:methylene-tetrahydromethanopterin dehydrogenase
MEKPSILHLVTTAKNMSPFDVNMAIDAGFAHIVPYTNVLQNEVIALTQDAMFSRSPSGVKREAMFFGGRDIHTALEMQNAAKSAMFAPFMFSTFADPSGAFTTAAAMLAKINAHFSLKNQTIAIFGASGPVGTTAALIAAAQGANVQMVAHRDIESMQAHADVLEKRYAVQVQALDGASDAAKTQVLNGATVAICAAAAGIRVLESAHFAQSKSLKIMTDVNAVAPSGVAGLDVMNDGQPIENTNIIGIGALAIGKLKYMTQHRLLQQLLSGSPAHLAYHDAFLTACAAL